MLDFDLAELYEVETRGMNQSIKRNADRFPEDFMFRLTAEEWKQMSSSQIVMMEKLPKNRTGKYLPYVFTEHGVTMLASILKSERAVKMPARLTPFGREHRHRPRLYYPAAISYAT